MKMLPSTIENQLIKIDHVKYPDQPTLIDYKFVFHKFPNPIEKNIESLKILLTTVELPPNFNLYVSLYANCFQLTTPIKIYSNIPTEILQFKYLPSQLAPDYQLQLVAHIDNTFLLDENGMTHMNVKHNSNNNDPLVIQMLKIDINLTIKYFQFENSNSIDKVSIFHYDDVRSLVVKNGKYFYIKKYV